MNKNSNKHINQIIRLLTFQCQCVETISSVLNSPSAAVDLNNMIPAVSK